jgi:hypothetical protein
MVVGIRVLTGGREETPTTEELIQAGGKEAQKRKERNAELRRRTKAREIAYYDNEAEYYPLLILPRGTRMLRRTIRRRAMRLLPPELHRGSA